MGVITAIVGLLVERKASPQLRTKQGRTPLELCPDEEARRALEELLAPQEERRKPKSSSYQDLKIMNNFIKSSCLKKEPAQIVRINDSADRQAIHRKAADVYTEHLERKEQTYEEEARREDKRRQLEERQRQEEEERSRDWVVDSEELKYYLEEEIRLFRSRIEEDNFGNKKDFDELIARISDKIEKPLDLKLYVYGSFATELCLKESDIDVVVVPENRADWSNLEILQKIDDILRKQDFVVDTKFIKTAVIPVIKVSCSEHYKNKRIDITLQDDNHNGLKCVEIIKEYMSTPDLTQNTSRSCSRWPSSSRPSSTRRTCTTPTRAGSAATASSS